MRYAAEEKLEIIRLVERSARPANGTLDKLGVPRRTFYRWYDRYLTDVSWSLTGNILANAGMLMLRKVNKFGFAGQRRGQSPL